MSSLRKRWRMRRREDAERDEAREARAILSGEEYTPPHPPPRKDPVVSVYRRALDLGVSRRPGEWDDGHLLSRAERRRVGWPDRLRAKRRNAR